MLLHEAARFFLFVGEVAQVIDVDAFFMISPHGHEVKLPVSSDRVDHPALFRENRYRYGVRGRS